MANRALRMTSATGIFETSPLVLKHPLQKGHTLLEILTALGLAMLVVGVAALGVGALGPEKRLRRSASVVESCARQLFWQSVQERRPHCLRLAADAVAADASPWVSLGNRARLEVRRVGESQWRVPGKAERWEFPGSGLCEPLSLRLAINGATLEMDFDPLTGAVAEERTNLEAGS